MITVRAPGFPSEEPPPAFRFVTIDGTRLRYLDQGSGTPVVLLHGNGSMIEDFVSSGIMEHAGPDRRLIAFDRPGFGHSERPRDRTWGPSQQASLLLDALSGLGIERPVVVGHSWGALVALAMALKAPGDVAGLVLMSGYYYPIPPPATVMLPAAMPFSSEAVRHAIRRIMAPQTLRRVFAPNRVPERFKHTYPFSLAMRACQMQAVEEEAGMLLSSTRALRQLYADISLPVHLIAGCDDRIVDTEQHSARLHGELPFSTFHRVPDCGHMVHHTAPHAVVATIAEIEQHHVNGAAALRAVAAAASRHPPRQWLHIGEDLVAA
jgi:pimeloyl-ACP methyl ester carboxylesterase